MVSIIILSYNTASLISACLTSVFTYCKGVPFEVIVVDNASKDQSVHLIKTKFPKARVIESQENLGFGKGINLGVMHAKGDLLLFLNSDAAFVDESLKGMVDFLNKNKERRVAVVGGKLLHKKHTTSSSFNTFYNLPKVFSLLFSKNERLPDYHKPTRVDWVSGGFMLILKEVFDKVNGFDPGYFMYIEDMDLCFRLFKRKYKTYYFPDARVDHIGQGSSNRSFAIVQIYKGLIYFYRKRKPRWQYYVVKSLLIVKAIVSYGIGILTNNVYLKNTYSSALRNIL